MDKKQYAIYKCPQCGYETPVTNVCRSCMRNMYPIGKECCWNETTKQEDYQELQDPKEYNSAKSWANIVFAGDKLEGKKIPEWVIKVMRDFFHIDLSPWEENQNC